MVSSTYQAICHGLLSASLVLLSFAVFLGFIRLLRGPSLPDRVIVLDALSMMTLSIIAVLVVKGNTPRYLDIAIALALISFLGVVAFAQFIEWQLGEHQPVNKRRRKR
ncbi:MAG: cation:proton antiporter [Gammaproteobacteria bacterium]|nr:cation:proton antiporter [Gammaproteobacteria bacterium]